MRLFIRDILLFVTPIAITLCVLEICLRQIPNDYSYKAWWLKKNISKVEILSLGSSHGYYGICPGLFKAPTFNAAHVSQSIKYDHFLFCKYIDNAKSLRQIILPMSYPSLCSDLEDGVEWWRVKYYCIYYNCPFHRFNPSYQFEIMFGFSNIYRFYKRIRDFVCDNKTAISCDSLGWGTNYCKVGRLDNWFMNGADRAKYHTCDIERKSCAIATNKQYVKDIIEQCYQKSIKVLLLTTPTCSTYYDNVDQQQLSLLIDFCDSMAGKYDNTEYLNLLKDCRFVEDDFFDADHCNEDGAKKLTLILSSYFNDCDTQNYERSVTIQ